MKLKESKTLFSAFADETRLRILSLLGEGELCVCDLMRVLKEPQSKISRHLAYLRAAGLVQGRKEGLWMHYRLSKPISKIHSRLLESVCGRRDDITELKKDVQILNRNRDCLVGCCQ